MMCSPVEHSLEVLREEFVGLVEAEDFAVVDDGDLLLHEVEDPAGRGHHEVHLLVDAHDVVLQVGPARRAHDPHAQVLGDLGRDLGGLQGQLAGWDDDHACGGMEVYS